MNTSARRPRPVPRRSSWGALALLVTCAALAGAPAASAEQQADVAYVANDQYLRVEHQYGAVTPAARRIPVASTTRDLVLGELWFPVTSAVVECDLLSAHDAVLTSRSWDREEWSTSPRVLPVPPGLVAPTPGTLYRVVCEDPDAPAGDSALWTLVEDESVAELGTIALVDSPELLTDVAESAYFYDDANDDQVVQTVHPGDRVSVRVETSASDTWAPSPGAAVLTAQLIPGRGSPTAMEDPALSADGRTFSFTIPAALPEKLLGRDVVSISADTVRPGSDTTAGYSRRSGWRDRVDVVAQRAASTTRLALAHPYAFSFLPGKVSVAVRSGGQPVTTGVVDISVDGTVARTVELTPSSLGRATVTLPRLPRGQHEVTARYAGSPSSQPSLSRPAALRVLR